MYKEVLESIQGIGLYGIISICLFFGFFTGVLLWSCRLKKNYLNLMGNLPLEDGNPPLPHLHPEPPDQARQGVAASRESAALYFAGHQPAATIPSSFIYTADNSPSPGGEGRGGGGSVSPPAFRPMGNQHQEL
jgi:hypothetical protein